MSLLCLLLYIVLSIPHSFGHTVDRQFLLPSPAQSQPAPSLTGLMQWIPTGLSASPPVPLQSVLPTAASELLKM